MSNIEQTRPNENFEDAQRIYENENLEGYVDNKGDIDWYKIKFAENGEANFYLKANDPTVDIDLAVFDSNEKRLGRSSNDAGIAELITLNVIAGEYYYIRVTDYSGNNIDDRRYLLRCKNYPHETQGDGNDDFPSAVTMDFGEIITGTVDQEDDSDFYYLRVRDIPTEYKAFLIMVDCDFPDFDGSYHCDLLVYNHDEERIGVSSVKNGELAYLKLPVNGKGYFIEVRFNGKYKSSDNKRYHLQTIGINCLSNRVQTCFDAATPIRVNDHIRNRLYGDENHFYSLYLEDSRDITFVAQTCVYSERLTMRIYDENRKIISEYSSSKPNEMHKINKNQVYYIEFSPENIDDDEYITYLFYTVPYGTGGMLNIENMLCNIQSVTPTIKPPYAIDQNVPFDITIKNNANYQIKPTVQAMLRDENDPQGSGYIMGSSALTVKPKSENTLRLNVRMAKTGFKDMVFEIKNSSINLPLNFEVRGYKIDTALNLVKQVEDFIRKNRPELNTTQMVFNATLTYFRSLIYNQETFNYMLGNGNSAIEEQVNNAFNMGSVKQINALINGTILEDNNSRIIDFIHMLAVLEGCIDAAKSNKENNSLCTGWLGDVASEAYNTVRRMKDTTPSKLSKEALKRSIFVECAQLDEVSCKAAVKDLEADIDAVAIYKLYRELCAESGNTNVTLYTLLSKYYKRYSDSYRNRYVTFKQETTRICGESNFNKCIYNGVLGKYDSYAGLSIKILSKGTNPKILIELARLFTEYINTEGQTKEGYNLTQNDLWWK